MSRKRLRTVRGALHIRSLFKSRRRSNVPRLPASGVECSVTPNVLESRVATPDATRHDDFPSSCVRGDAGTRSCLQLLPRLSQQLGQGLYYLFRIGTPEHHPHAFDARESLQIMTTRKPMEVKRNV